MCQPRVSALYFAGNVGMDLRKTLDVRFVDDRIVIGNFWSPVPFPIEIVVDYNGLWYKRRAVGSAQLQIFLRIADFISKQGVVPFDGAANSFSVRINDQFCRIETMAVGRIVWSMNAVAVQLSRLQARHIDVIKIVGS